jgi:uncharacterized membrane protein
MQQDRLAAFSDGVIAIILTIMVLELKAPHGAEWSNLKPLAPIFLSYILSFIYIAIYWNNHHHLLHTSPKVDGAILWANMHLLFWLSLVPFASAWMGDNYFEALPTALYGVPLFMSSVAYYLLQLAIAHRNKADGTLVEALGDDLRGKLSPVFYLIAIGVAFYLPWFSQFIYVCVASAWLIPDRRIEVKIAEAEEQADAEKAEQASQATAPGHATR